MSKILKTNPYADHPCSHYVKTDDGNFYYVDSCWSGIFPIGNGWETIVVKCNKNLHVSPKNWQNPEYVETYGSEQEMADSHAQICNDLESALQIYN